MSGSDRPRIAGHKRAKHKGRRAGHSFVQLPHYMIRSPQFYAIRRAHTLLLFLASQYNGSNNGDLSATKDMVKEMSVCTPSKLDGLLKLLESAGFIVRTRHGVRKVCNLYALTWYPIDECPGKFLEIAAGPARNDWRKTDSLAPKSHPIGPPWGPEQEAA